VNNLPAYDALLVGTNVGPLVSTVAALALTA
jgi:hypothetical protein